MDDLREFEEKLKGYRPVAPGALPEGRPRVRGWMLAAASAAAAVIAVVLIADGLLKSSSAPVRQPELRRAESGPKAEREVSLASLRRVAGDEAALAAALDAASPRLLRRVGGEGMRAR